jgi:hypothetical protein
MYFLRHQFADISFLTQSDVEIKILQDGGFKRFITHKASYDVYHQVRKVDDKDLTLPALSCKEQEQNSHCMQQPRLGPGTFILPPLIRKDEAGNRFDDLHFNQNPFDFPLVRSPVVRDRLEDCLNHTDQIGLLLHIFSVEIFDYEQHRIDLFYHSDQRWLFEKFPLENGIRRLFTSFLPSFSALMLHSSGVVRSRAALFFAPHAGGKSTTLRNLKNGTILSDDQNILRKEGGDFLVYSTPWGANHCEPYQAPLGGLFLIEKASRFELIPIHPIEIFEFLWAEHLHVWSLLPKQLRIQAFDLLNEACHQAPCYRMRFPKDYIDWDAIDAVMAK